MKFRLLIITLILGAPRLLFAQNYTFPRNLRIGMSGDDVFTLQKMLNLDTTTQIANEGPGSPGNETSYFGKATERAVTKFQEKYSADVLSPAGLTMGTGYFGQATRQKMNTLSGAGNTETASETSGTTSAAPGGTKSSGLTGIVIKPPSQYSGGPGTSITFGGWGFTSTGNTIYFGTTHKVENIPSPDGYTLAFNVPNIPAGSYVVTLKNNNGESQNKTFFAVTNGTVSAPKIEKIMPSSAKRGDTVTINGTGFTGTGNMLRTTLGVFENIPSANGTTLSFTIPQDTFTVPPSGFSIPTSTPPLGTTQFLLPILVYVANGNGLSNGQSFTGNF